ncbi:MAG: PD-(D/E)XK nuclease family protein [Bacteriovoracales bacterium]|nr:PD-(D/E)XK nuclease family protein [Bacteriovoracales bacterium]
MSRQDLCKEITFSEDEKIKWTSFLTTLESSLVEASTLAHDLSKKNIIKAILKFSSIGIENPTHLQKSLFNLYDLAEHEMISRATQLKLDKVSKESNLAPDYFSFLSKNLDENYYSDFIAAILNFKFSNNFNHRVLSRLCSLFSIDIEEGTETIAYREVPLSRFGESENATMRLDIFINLNEVGVLVIENKTRSKEHSCQTRAYYKAINLKFPKEKIYCLFLTPDGSMATHQEFVPLSYNDFYEILISEFVRTPFLSNELKLIIPFFIELQNSFVQSYLNIVHRAMHYREVA